MLSLPDLKKFGGGRHIITYGYVKSSSCRIQKVEPKSVLPALTMLTVWCSTLQDWFKNCIPDDWASQCDSSGVRDQLEDTAPPCTGLYTGIFCTGLYLYTGILALHRIVHGDSLRMIQGLKNNLRSPSPPAA